MSQYRAPAGAPCWMDLMSSDPAAVTPFYEAVFGWQADEPNPDFGGYTNFRLHGEYVAGLMGRMPDSPVGDVWSIYLRTDDAAATTKRAAEHGGSTMIEPMPVADLGTMAVVIDPAGAPTGLWQPGTHRGFSRYREHGAPYWFDVVSQGYDAAVGFYSTVFGWTTEAIDEPGMRYTTGLVDGQEVAGIGDGTIFDPDQHSFWQVYLTVDDTDAAVATIVEQGGGVLHAAQDTPWGRLALVQDPLGAKFQIAQALGG